MGKRALLKTKKVFTQTMWNCNCGPPSSYWPAGRGSGFTLWSFYISTGLTPGHQDLLENGFIIILAGTTRMWLVLDPASIPGTIAGTIYMPGTIAGTVYTPGTRFATARTSGTSYHTAHNLHQALNLVLSIHWAGSIVLSVRQAHQGLDVILSVWVTRAKVIHELRCSSPPHGLLLHHSGHKPDLLITTSPNPNDLIPTHTNYILPNGVTIGVGGITGYVCASINSYFVLCWNRS